MRYIITFIFIILLNHTAFAAPLKCSNPDEVIKQMDELMRGVTNYSEMEMKVVSPRWVRSVKIKSWSMGAEKSFLTIVYPKKDYGVTFLRVGQEMWQYIPKIERTIKIPPSMMLQSWMGSDFTNDDLVRESSIIHDYTKSVLEDKNNICIFKLTAKEDAPVVWGSIIIRVNLDYIMPEKAEYYDEDGVLVRVLEYKDIKKLKTRYYPTKWILKPVETEKIGRYTEINVINTEFDIPLDEDVFSIRALKKYSR